MSGEKQLMKKFWIILLCLLLAAAVFYLLWSGSGFLLSKRELSKIELPQEVRILPSASAVVGGIVPFQGEFRLPRYREIIHFSITPGKGTVIARPMTVKKAKSSWKYNTWLFEGSLCCIRPGESKTGTITLELSPASAEAPPEKFIITIPVLKIGELSPAAEISTPELASAAAPPAKDISPWHLLWLLLLLIPLFYWLLKKRKQLPPPLSLRRRTLNALDSLRTEVHARRMSAKEGIAGVSDLLRLYLEERYALPASGKTTPEFLSEMEFTAAIPGQAGSFLKNFLNAADMIKFAQAPCDAPAVTTAINSAVELVENTSEPEKEEK